MAKRTLATTWQQIEKSHNQLASGKKTEEESFGDINALLEKIDVQKQKKTIYLKNSKKYEEKEKSQQNRPITSTQTVRRVLVEKQKKLKQTLKYNISN